MRLAVKPDSTDSGWSWDYTVQDWIVYYGNKTGADRDDFAEIFRTGYYARPPHSSFNIWMDIRNQGAHIAGSGIVAAEHFVREMEHAV